MSRSVELSDENDARLGRAAEVERITPAEWIARRPHVGERAGAVLERETRTNDGGRACGARGSVRQRG